MKTKLFNLFVAACAALMFAPACQEKPETDVEDKTISVQPDRLEASWEGQIFDVEVTSNCTWTISKTDTEGSAVDWVKCDRANGNGTVAFRIRVYKNETTSERLATVTLASDDTKAFIDVKQEGNPNPNPGPGPGPGPGPDPGTDPEPYGDVVKLTFDFTQTPFDGWPTAGGYDHTEGGITCIYPLGGREYSFVLADCGKASAAQMHWALASDDFGNRLAFGAQYRYLGLPAIEGYRLGIVACTSVLLNEASATLPPKMAITNKIAASAADAKLVNDESDDIVPGGKFQTWQAGGGGTYTYTLTGTELNTVYYVYALVKGAVSTLEITYYKDGYTPDPGTDPNPGDDPDPGTDPNPGDDPNPPSGDEFTLHFDFTITPLADWPTAAYDHTEGGISRVYPLDGTDYTFILADCGGASKANMFWALASGDLGNRLAFAAQYRYLGLPAIAGFKLTKISCESVRLNAQSASIKPKVAITHKIAASAADAKAITDESDDIIAGGQFQEWQAGGGGTYTYTLTSTEVNTVYYMYAQVKGAISHLYLTYAK